MAALVRGFEERRQAILAVRPPSPIDGVRARLYDDAVRVAAGPGGIYRLPAPTGSGKTITSAGFALHHAARWGKSRVIVAVPFLTITEQNAGVFRQLLPNATKADRYGVKPMVYGKLYSAGIPTLAAQVGCGLDLAHVVVTILDAITPLAAWSASCAAGASRAGQVPDLFWGDAAPAPRAGPRPPNYAIQRTAREILVDAMLRWRYTPRAIVYCCRCTTNSSPWSPKTTGPRRPQRWLSACKTDFHGVPIVPKADQPSQYWIDVS